MVISYYFLGTGGPDASIGETRHVSLAVEDPISRDYSPLVSREWRNGVQL